MQATEPKLGVAAWIAPTRRHLGIGRQLTPAIALVWILVHLPLASAAGLTVEKASSLAPIPQQRQSRGFEEAMRSGTEALESGDFSEAVEAFARAVSLQPRQPLALALLGSSLLAAERAEEALEPLGRAVELDPQLFIAQQNLGTALLELKRYKEALTSLQAAARLSPGDASVLYDQAIAHLALEQREEAVEILDEVIVREPSHGEAWSLLGRTLVGDTGDLEAQVRAAQALEKTLELRPGDLKASVDLASLYSRFGLDGEALEVLDAAASTAPESESLELERFRILQRLGEYRMARWAVEHAIELGAGADAHYYLGFALKNLGEVDGAIQAFRTATEVDPGMGLAHRELGSLLIDRQLFDEARIALQQVVATTASDPEAHYLLGLALLRGGDPEGAIPSLERAVQLAPDDSRAHYSLATALRMAGRSEESVSTMRRFQELRALAQPGIARMQQHVGRLIRQGVFLAKMGRAERAVHAFQRGLENDPDNDLILFNLGVALRDVGNREEAVSALERAIEINPDRAAAYAALANAYSALGRLEDAARMRARYEEVRRRRQGSE